MDNQQTPKIVYTLGSEIYLDGTRHTVVGMNAVLGALILREPRRGKTFYYFPEDMPTTSKGTSLQ